MVSDVTLSGINSDRQNTGVQQQQLAEDFDQFLQLLTTQLQNQDPLSPMDSTEFTNQIVQFSQVEQSINTNQKLDSLLALQVGGAASSALGYVGLDVSYISAELPFNGTDPIDIRYSLDGNAFQSRINIFDENNTLVFTQDAEITDGVHDFRWDGRNQIGQSLPEGTYVITVDAFDAEDKKVPTETVVRGRVKGIEAQDGVVFALVGERAVPIPNILNASLPTVTSATDNQGGTNG
ncbi:MAG: flagellar hook assembly protein FlgD [Alphaproteobacteria bacterium]|nr:flagellar hook assembly protein FlgD [Alphaproteobacteria bacterium]NCQ87579.1 flagellar hook assembly protein FlgD [Alphaproteobacteria bacterium]NCT06448.1 flagellar hook assembly protein FlgD [Alphaproteobacteria bacterium]